MQPTAAITEACGVFCAMRLLMRFCTTYNWRALSRKRDYFIRNGGAKSIFRYILETNAQYSLSYTTSISEIPVLFSHYNNYFRYLCLAMKFLYAYPLGVSVPSEF